LSGEGKHKNSKKEKRQPLQEEEITNLVLNPSGGRRSTIEIRPGDQGTPKKRQRVAYREPNRKKGDVTL